MSDYSLFDPSINIENFLSNNASLDFNPMQFLDKSESLEMDNKINEDDDKLVTKKRTRSEIEGILEESTRSKRKRVKTNRYNNNTNDEELKQLLGEESSEEEYDESEESDFDDSEFSDDESDYDEEVKISEDEINILVEGVESTNKSIEVEKKSRNWENKLWERRWKNVELELQKWKNQWYVQYEELSKNFNNLSKLELKKLKTLKRRLNNYNESKNILKMGYIDGRDEFQESKLLMSLCTKLESVEESSSDNEIETPLKNKI